MRILIRADGGRDIGMGHIMRTLTLARELNKYFEVIYVCKTENEDRKTSVNGKYAKGIHKILSSGFKVKIVRENNMVEDLYEIKGDILITDSYDVNEEYFKKTSEMFHKTIYIDDMCLYDFKDVDMIINQNINADNLKYDAAGNKSLLLGCRYVMLRDEFKDLGAKIIRRKVRDVMITTGGADPFLLTLKLLYYLKQENYNFHVVVGSSFDDIYVEKLKTYEELKNINFYYNANMKELMKKCDACISAAGSTLYELCSVGVPSLSITVAENQSKAAEKFDALKIIKNLGWHNELTREKVLEEINSLSNDYNRRKNVSMTSQSIIDGMGTQRIVEKILDMV
ncbi:UDP-2,4-diacetamido-2,4,6-trideoxy-beta-L-altropyranose hydrolase [Clostridium acetobutylicum]|uniref:Glycosyltransferase n=1 Tax=Clostridium acetobutylicum (strain ATCC 824 / DSM 792 / JCM 1419 / IAM 19013 / LMG 5710 / NBRC 13948 / NRRL B-527 / VKM B-1787 / 2291 / W) TaxID=272562 RepID=Q97H27_CLOAB|nr:MULTISPECIES: UDP-2,4-diacetamido-2,4,6-trideoxy-beta-L-altropyranose hydrolase [Clostridium]AAK80144.1 Glycosyltransferase [Clostridium acetobutylicum ATCC 824]ADZ21237.1 Glycosyltransferase [Clostridium acetobutylicum EA 2018]AEI32217.1 glycosyltransferase [Clostridium acetobutylicum DSM 1731]AWV79431.1 UDP-2,4-diacetamido-2,4,6-trideoxy-beta-L-altropyranose hydrolase [Clostridium acetobutylicum]MBC2394597.1 UDP-2,4-diacetamido-2,4,6-trideoxy-beta-L-altropyranose hydrolase [Clostridium ac